jgi:uncharacterized RDD family membrane protein YckC
MAWEDAVPGRYPAPAYGTHAQIDGPPLAIRASFWLRLVSVLIDEIILGLTGLVILVLVGLAAGESVADALHPVLHILTIPYYIYFWSQRGQTLGGMALGLRLVNARGENPTVGKAILRYFAEFLSMLPFGLGYLWALGHQRRTWHDILANTWVIRESE